MLTLVAGHSVTSHSQHTVPVTVYKTRRDLAGVTKRHAWLSRFCLVKRRQPPSASTATFSPTSRSVHVGVDERASLVEP